MYYFAQTVMYNIFCDLNGRPTQWFSIILIQANAISMPLLAKNNLCTVLSHIPLLNKDVRVPHHIMMCWEVEGVVSCEEYSIALVNVVWDIVGTVPVVILCRGGGWVEPSRTLPTVALLVYTTFVFQDLWVVKLLWYTLQYVFCKAHVLV